MSEIWQYPDQDSELYEYHWADSVVPIEGSLANDLGDVWNCPYCRSTLAPLRDPDSPPFEASDFYQAITLSAFTNTPLFNETGGLKDMDESPVWKQVFVCTLCGWWKAQLVMIGHINAMYKQIREGCGVLKKLDLSDVSTPVSQVKNYLLARYEARKELHPQLFEETVGSVFRDHGYDADVTTYSNDGGIDVILKKSEETIGVQVKRYADRIQVEQIRAFAGALLLSDIPRGIFVTTSDFSSGAIGAAGRYSSKGYRIELVDANRFYDYLRISRREMYRDVPDFETMFDVWQLPVREDLSGIG